MVSKITIKMTTRAKKWYYDTIDKTLVTIICNVVFVETIVIILFELTCS